MEKKKKKKRTIGNSLPNNDKIVNIESFYDKDGNCTIGNKDGYFQLSFYLDDSVFYNDEEYNRFIKAVERMVRTSPDYKNYIAVLKMQYGLNYCMVLGNVDDSDDVTVEMHHGPLMTLYDVVSLIVNHSLVNRQKISTFSVADMVLREHYDHNVQVIMLSKTVHEMVHKGKIFINTKQCIGDINTLLIKYRDGITKELAEGINKYIEMCENNETTDNGYFQRDGEIQNWNVGSKVNLDALEYDLSTV